jgi:hypothetical protein
MKTRHLFPNGEQAWEGSAWAPLFVEALPDGQSGESKTRFNWTSVAVKFGSSMTLRFHASEEAARKALAATA